MARGWADHQEQPVDQNAPEADRRNVPDDVISVVRPPTEMIVAMKATATPAARVKAQTLNPLFRKCPTSNLCLSTPIQLLEMRSRSGKTAPWKEMRRHSTSWTYSHHTGLWPK